MQKEIGRGNYSKVYMAIEFLSRQPYAVKIIQKDNQSHLVLQTLKIEIEIMRKIKHPRIINLHYVYETDEAFHLILDYVRGGELHKRLKMAKYPEQIAAIFMKNLIQTLDFLHRNGIVHRDIKPENILVLSGDNYTEFKLCDFGLSAFLNDSDGLTLRCGSPGFVAPEILRRQKYDFKVDIFSAGIICYIMLIGKSPFAGSNPNDVLAKNRECKIDFEIDEFNNISKLARDFVMALTQEDSDRRPSAMEVLNHPWINKISSKKTPEALKSRVSNTFNLRQLKTLANNNFLQSFSRSPQSITPINKIDSKATIAKSRKLMRILREEEKFDMPAEKQLFEVKTNSTKSKESQESCKSCCAVTYCGSPYQ